LIIENYIRSAKETDKQEGYKEVPLTKREIEILKYIAEGNSNQEIANKLYISYNTVDTHRKNIMHKPSIKIQRDSSDTQLKRLAALNR
jgi:DNA-binding CsgD family transcriptional regulator